MYENEETSIENNDNLSEESSESAQIQNGENENQDILENDNSETLQEADTEPNDTLMVDVVGIRFKKAGKVYSFDPSGFELKTGDNVIVETARGMEVGQVARTVVKVFESMVNKPLKPVVRMATEEDMENAIRLESKEDEALVECAETVRRMNIPMKLISAEYNLEGNHLTIFFGAEGRIDFRELVRELSHKLKTRIEMRQVGPRDEAKLIGGYGRCGRPLCCATFLNEFNPVSIKMAKEQNLPLNPMKISGTCGRLLCCLGYEFEQYRDMKKELLKNGENIQTSMGSAVVVGGNPLKGTVLLEVESGARVEMAMNEISPKKEEKEKEQEKGREQEPRRRRRKKR
ncbi:MAG: stage 0 sporulation family protein [Dehalococcoidales bacterium]|jgi:cell fate regulator YaaT (PSP1 superfamily)|nr:stage 0 sporulation family protein [Dehalococcoidales bacterium]MDD3994517.1 stage 0 sporulation family protein [Dehalococcoidales bacterium]